MHSSTVPVTGDGLRVQGDHNSKVLSHSVQEVAGHPQVVAHGDALTRTHLELPLGRHHLGVGARDVDAGEETSSVVGFHHVTSVDLVSAHTAVVGPLGSWVAILGPTQRVLVHVKESVLLLHTEPRV